MPPPANDDGAQQPPSPPPQRLPNDVLFHMLAVLPPSLLPDAWVVFRRVCRAWRFEVERVFRLRHLARLELTLYPLVTLADVLREPVNAVANAAIRAAEAEAQASTDPEAATHALGTSFRVLELQPQPPLLSLAFAGLVVGEGDGDGEREGRALFVLRAADEGNSNGNRAAVVSAARALAAGSASVNALLVLPGVAAGDPPLAGLSVVEDDHGDSRLCPPPTVTGISFLWRPVVAQLLGEEYRLRALAAADADARMPLPPPPLLPDGRASGSGSGGSGGGQVDEEEGYLSGSGPCLVMPAPSRRRRGGGGGGPLDEDDAEVRHLREVRIRRIDIARRGDRGGHRDDDARRPLTCLETAHQLVVMPRWLLAVRTRLGLEDLRYPTS
ncbi:hypothetical protein GGR56DRAFT_634815 [Xylariaceae sp. FL0804]|nr:hypothetical protein GGR56DRAFT_634815 [Xylariaceae sp. FL0804]